jgi:hypothetical protein
MQFPFSVRNLIYTWMSLRPWTESLIRGIPFWPIVPIICLFAWGAQALPQEWYAAVLTTLFIMMWYGAVWAMGQQDIRDLTFKSGRAWFIGAIIVFLAGMAPVMISLPLLLVGTYLVIEWDKIISAKKGRYALIGIGVICVTLVLNAVYPGKFMPAEAAFTLPIAVFLLAPKQIHKLVSWIYSAISLGVAGFATLGAIGNGVPEQYRSLLITVVVAIFIGALFWTKRSSKGRLISQAHQEKKEAAANGETARKLRRWLFVLVMAAYLVVHGAYIAGKAHEALSILAIILAGAGFVYALWYRLSLYDQQHRAVAQANGL